MALASATCPCSRYTAAFWGRRGCRGRRTTGICRCPAGCGGRTACVRATGRIRVSGCPASPSCLPCGRPRRRVRTTGGSRLSGAVPTSPAPRKQEIDLAHGACVLQRPPAHHHGGSMQRGGFAGDAEAGAVLLHKAYGRVAQGDGAQGVKPAYCRVSGRAANFSMGDTPPLRGESLSMRRTSASSTGSLMRVSLLMKRGNRLRPLSARHCCRRQSRC